MSPLEAGLLNLLVARRDYEHFFSGSNARQRRPSKRNQSGGCGMPCAVPSPRALREPARG
jgi:hypothetical protein